MKDEYLLELKETLRELGLKVDEVAGTLNITQGTGILASKTNLDPLPFLESLPEERASRRREFLGYSRGVKHVLLEPKRSDASTWSFVESAGSILPSLELGSFAKGAEAAAGTAPFTLPFRDGVILAYLMRLSRGVRVLTAQQVQDWGVAKDRITAGARSLLFHRTRELHFRPFEGSKKVSTLKAGDGHDAARYLVVADAFYSEVDSRFHFAIPSSEVFLCVFQNDKDSLEELRRAALSVYETTDSPLSLGIYSFDGSTPVPVR